MAIHLLVASQDTALEDLSFSVSKPMGFEASTAEAALNVSNAPKIAGIDVIVADACMPGLDRSNLSKPLAEPCPK